MIQVVIVHEIRLMCDIISASLKNDPTVEVVGCATNLEEAKAKGPQSDVVLVSSALPNKGALAVTQALKSARPKVVVLGLPESEPAILQFIEAGAIGYVSGENSTDELVETIHTVYTGKARISPGVAAALIARMTELSDWIKHNNGSLEEHKPRASLTDRECEILSLIAHGYSNQEIAQQLMIELGTVKNHVHNILKKLNVTSRAEAAACLPWIESTRSGAGRSARPGPEPRHSPIPSRSEDTAFNETPAGRKQNSESARYDSWVRVPMTLA